MSNQQQKNWSQWLCLAIASTTITACGALNAQPMERPGGGPKPPPEAFQSCKSLKSGDDCNFTAPKGAVSGNCWAPEGKPLACKPKDAPPPKQ